MAVVPVKSTVPPTDLVGQTNGALDSRLLTTLAGNARLHHLVARGWRALAAAAREAGGWTLWWTSSADTYRTHSVQLSTFLARYQPVTAAVYAATPLDRRKAWLSAPALGYGSPYWIKRNIGSAASPRYPATAAVPGTSPHGLGCAIDGAFPGPVGWTAALPWLIVNARRFGFAWSLQSEPWHIQWVMGDVVPQAVLDYETPTPTPGPTPKPPPVIPPKPKPKDDDMAEYLIHYPAKADPDHPPVANWTLLRMVGLEVGHIGGAVGSWLPQLRAHAADELVADSWQAMVEVLDGVRTVGACPDTFKGGGGDLEAAWERNRA